MIYPEMIVSFIPVCCIATCICCCLSGSYAYASRRKNRIHDENAMIPPKHQTIHRDIVVVESPNQLYIGVPCSTK